MASSNIKKPIKVVETEKGRWVATIDGWKDFYNWMANFVFNLKGKKGIKIDDKRPDKPEIQLDQESIYDVISGNAFRYVNGELVDCVFVYDGQTYDLGNKKVGTGKHYLHIKTNNPSSSTISSSASTGDNEIVIPLCEIGSEDEIVNSYLGCPVIDDGSGGTSTYWYYDKSSQKLKGCTAFLGAGGYALSSSDVSISPSGSSTWYANITFGENSSLSVSTSSGGDFSIRVCEVNNGKVRALNGPIIVPCWG